MVSDGNLASRRFETTDSGDHWLARQIPWEDDGRRTSSDFHQYHSTSKLWKQIRQKKLLIDVVETFEDASVKLNTQFTDDRELEELATYVMLCSEFLITAKGSMADRRIQFIAKEFEWLKLLKDPKSKNHYSCSLRVSEGPGRPNHSTSCGHIFEGSLRIYPSQLQRSKNQKKFIKKSKIQNFLP